MEITAGMSIKTYTNCTNLAKKVEQVFHEEDGNVYRIKFLHQKTNATDLVQESDIRQIKINGKWIDFE